MASRSEPRGVHGHTRPGGYRSIATVLRLRLVTMPVTPADGRAARVTHDSRVVHNSEAHPASPGRRAPAAATVWAITGMMTVTRSQARTFQVALAAPPLNRLGQNGT